MTNNENATTHPNGMGEMGLATETVEHHLTTPSAHPDSDAMASGLAALEAETED